MSTLIRRRVLRRLIWVYIVCLGLSVPILRVSKVIESVDGAVREAQNIENIENTEFKNSSLIHWKTILLKMLWLILDLKR